MKKTLKQGLVGLVAGTAIALGTLGISGCSNEQKYTSPKNDISPKNTYIIDREKLDKLHNINYEEFKEKADVLINETGCDTYKDNKLYEGIMNIMFKIMKDFSDPNEGFDVY